MSLRPVTVVVRQQDGRLLVETPAKVNLALLVGERRTDGYHELATVFVAVDLQDRLELLPAEELGISVEGAAPADESNLCLRAARTYAEASGQAVRRHIRLVKRIPAGGGLGGGSGNAAGVLLALDAAASHPLGRDRLAEIASSLGSDVPFFLYGGTCTGTGRGERIEPWAEPLEICGNLVLPDITIDTASVYKTFAERIRSAQKRRILPLTLGNVVVWVGKGRGEDASREPSPDHFPTMTCRTMCHHGVSREHQDGRMDAVRVSLQNDLQAAAFAFHPPLREVFEQLTRAGVPSILCGSGSSFFVPAADAGEAELQREKLEGLGAGRVLTVKSWCGGEEVG